jgi:hypothetical protein
LCQCRRARCKKDKNRGYLLHGLTFPRCEVALEIVSVPFTRKWRKEWHVGTVHTVPAATLVDQ